MAKLKQLKQHEEIFYPVTVGQAVIFEDDSTSAKVTDEEMDEIFGLDEGTDNINDGNYISFIENKESSSLEAEIDIRTAFDIYRYSY